MKKTKHLKRTEFKIPSSQILLKSRRQSQQFEFRFQRHLVYKQLKLCWCIRNMQKILHKTIYENRDRFEALLPLTDSLKVFHVDGTFHLIKDPVKHQKSSIIGMFVLRPTVDPWVRPILTQSMVPSSSMNEVKGGWAFNFRGLDGGWLIADGSPVDAYRLAFQYAISDAVMVGSRTVSEEGCNTTCEDGLSKLGYLWQSYEVCKWPHLYSIDPNLSNKFDEQRVLLQKLGYISSRKYPAQIFVSWSGAGSFPVRDFLNRKTNDFLQARAFHDHHPNGDEIEVYIISSKNGCKSIIERAQHIPHLKDRIHNILFDLSPENQPNEIDLQLLPTLMYNKYNMKIINNDGGQQLLKKCYKAKIMSQMNITLCRNKSLKEVITNHRYLSSDIITDALTNFEEKVDSYFSNTSSSSSRNNNYDDDDDDDSNIGGGIPTTFIPCSIIADESHDVAVVTFATDGIDDF